MFDHYWSNGVCAAQAAYLPPLSVSSIIVVGGAHEWTRMVRCLHVWWRIDTTLHGGDGGVGIVGTPKQLPWLCVRGVLKHHTTIDCVCMRTCSGARHTT